MKTINIYQRRVLYALVDVEAARAADTSRGRRHMRHGLFVLIRERYGCKATRLPQERYGEVVQWLLDEPLARMKAP